MVAVKKCRWGVFLIIENNKNFKLKISLSQNINNNQGRIQNPVKHLRWNFISVKASGAWQGSGYATDTLLPL